MRTVQMTLDADLIEEVDRAAATQGKSRSAFTRDALRAAVIKVRERELEEKYRLAYQRQPWAPGEIEEDWDDWKTASSPSTPSSPSTAATPWAPGETEEGWDDWKSVSSPSTPSSPSTSATSSAPSTPSK
jgi:hypothetical protein